ncbi:MAG: tRNA-intron lyase [Nitrososphaerota archaeon]|jgi:tRNA-intron endonuclease|nr:tRNA-intron lyase [Nitrososphaerota archaeon]MDG6967545.1 tRNA-intron lyase [Nitrososphaerota archaeon]MDG6978870.1 tRNA-intron lyase [Nitrososphaerota archaeon]MDG7021791.1 tRNA-intron lyase [Nitrososphaerota archaeon]
MEAQEQEREEPAQPAREPIVASTDKSGAVVVEQADRFAELQEGGYGERHADGLMLKDFEALYLLYSGKMALKDAKGKEVTFEALAKANQSKVKDSWTKFMIYRDLRSRGYVVKDGFGFGTDLRVYERGDFPAKAAKFVVFALDEGTEKSLGDLRDSVKQIVRMGKEAIVAVIERRGEVIYYKVTKATFRK